MVIHCRQCQQMLTHVEGAWFCNGCGARYASQAQCPECHRPLEVLKACGAVDYFCPQHGLISSKRVEYLPCFPDG